MKKIILVSVLVMLFVSATPSGISAGKPIKGYHSDPVSTQVDSVNVMVKELLELSKKL